MRASVLRLSLILWTLLASTATSADWPAWRHDSSRSAVSKAKLPGNLTLQWTRELEPVEPAWEEDPRIYFDAHLEPIVQGQLMFVGSSVTDSVAAFDTNTGKEQWRFFANGPIRFAPVAQNGKLWFGSDDGHVYCLSVKDGSLVWKFNAAPALRKVIGNERLISVWPVRGGPVVDEDQVHFTVGVWPFEGTFLYTLNATSGKLIVNKDGLPAIKALKDVTPQGYLTLAQNRLSIPTGRGNAYCLDRRSGAPVSHRCTSRGLSDYHVVTVGPWMFHGNRIYNLEKKTMMPQQLVRPVVAKDAIYGIFKGKLIAYDLKKLGSKTVKDRRGRPTQVPVLSEKWNLALNGLQKGASANDLRVDLLAGDTLYGHQGKLVFAVKPPEGDKPASVVWKKMLDDEVATAIAANDRLFVVAKNGKISCFGGEEVKAPATYTLAKENVANPKDGFAEKAKQILAQTGQTEGYCLCFGLKDGRLIEELAKQSKLTIIALDADENKVKTVRSNLHRQGLYGARVVCCVGDAANYGLPPYIANLIVSENPENLHKDAYVEQTFHCLRPYGGIACLTLTQQQHETLNKHVVGIQLPRAKVGRRESFTFVRREGALPGSGDWTHEYGDAQNTLSSSDKLVKAPLGLLWFGGPASSGKLFYDRHFWGPSMAVIDGRMFLQGPSIFTAVDVYTGRILWQRKMPNKKSLGRRGNFTNIGFHYVALKDSLYLSDATNILRLDPKSGKVLATFAPLENTLGWGRFRVWNNQLLVTVFTMKEKLRMPTALVSINRFNGEVAWSKQAKQSFQLFSLGKDKALCFDATMPDLYASWKRKGKIPKALKEKKVMALDLRTGKEVWSSPTEQVVSWLSSSVDHDVTLSSNKDSIVARRSSDGAVLWEKKATGKGFKGHPESVWDKVIILGDRILDQRGPGFAYELKTGKPVMRVNPLTGKQEEWQFTKQGHHCNYAIANEHLMTFRAATAGFCELDSANTSRLNGFRSGCRNSLIPANGVLNAPNMAHGCVCSYNLFTSLALVHVPEAEQWAYSALKTPAGPLKQVGINFGAPGDRLANNGTLWLDYPNVGGSSPAVNVKVQGEGVRYYHRLAEQLKGEGLRWVAGSGVEGVTEVTVNFLPTSKSCKVRLYFAEWEKKKVGERVFDVSLDGKVVLKDLDVFKEAKGSRRVLVKELEGVDVGGALRLKFTAKADRAILSGIEVISE